MHSNTPWGTRSSSDGDFVGISVEIFWGIFWGFAPCLGIFGDFLGMFWGFFGESMRDAALTAQFRTRREDFVGFFGGFPGDGDFVGIFWDFWGFCRKVALGTIGFRKI